MVVMAMIVLNGGSGADTLTRGDGNDKYIIGNAVNDLHYRRRVKRNGIHYSMLSTGGPFDDNVENLILKGSSDIDGMVMV